MQWRERGAQLAALLFIAALIAGCGLLTQAVTDPPKSGACTAAEINAAELTHEIERCDPRMPEEGP